MAATAYILSFHGVGGTTTDVTAGEIKHKLADNDTDDLLTPIPIPTSGTGYGWCKHTKIYFDPSPNSQISNLRWYQNARPTTGDSATEWGGVTMWAGLSAAYSQATSADESALRPGVVDTDNYTTGSPLTVESGTVLSNPTIGYGTQDYLVQQMSVNDTAVSGDKAARNSYYRYNEI